MIKKLFAITAILASFIAFTACSDDADTTSNAADGVTPADDYTVIFLGEAGNNDDATLTDFYTLLGYREKGTIGSNVNFVGLLKAGEKFQNNLQLEGLGGTYYFELGTKRGIDIPKLESKRDTASIVSGYKNLYSMMTSYKRGARTYALNNVDTLANFIKEVAAKHPAKHYVLMIYGHGSGFVPAYEIPNPDAYTRSCLNDGNNSHKGITADNLVASVNKPGVKIQTIFFQNCLMATLENMAAYKNCTDYV